MSRHWRRAFCVALLAVVAALAGCGQRHPATYRGGGRVTFPDGAPLTGGWVEFQPVNAPRRTSARGRIQPDGTFRLGTFGEADGALPGPHRVLVVPPPPGVDIDSVKQIPEVIHPRYKQFDTSGLTFTVSEDPARNVFSIVVDRPPNQK